MIAAPGREPVFCPALPQPAIGRPKEAAPSCPAEYAVTLKNFDLNKLGDAETIQGCGPVPPS